MPDPVRTLLFVLLVLRDPRDNGDVTLYFDISIPYGHMRRQMER